MDSSVMLTTAQRMQALQEKADRADKEKAEALAALERMRLQEPMRNQVKAAMKMDLVFVIDVTRSMQPYWDAVVKRVNSLVSQIEAMHRYAQDNVRVGFVGYRDFKDKPQFEVLPLQAAQGGSIAAASLEWLGRVRCEGGDDFAEDVHGALEKAGSAEMGWGNGTSTRTVVLITDAPGHGERLRRGLESIRIRDDHPNHDSDGSELKRLLRHLREKVQVQKLLFLHAGAKYKGHTLTRPMADQFVEDCGDPAFVKQADWEGEAMMVESVVTTVIESFSRSMVSGVKAGGTKAERPYTIDPAKPDWDKLKAVKVKSLTCHDVNTATFSLLGLIEMIKKGNHLRTRGKELHDDACIKIAPNPFAMGSTRLAYYAQYYPFGEGGGEEGRDVVVKEFISRAKGANSAVYYKAQMETQTVATILAHQFNAAAKDAGLNLPEVRYAECDMLCVPQVDNPKLLRFLMVEPLLVGVMRKWNNNAGIVYAPDPQLHLQAFSHWTYEVTDKKLMVVDVQGFKMPAEGSAAPRILLVDPAIHCVGTDYFTSTNCGGEGGAGFDLFLESHRNPKTHYCGKACKAVRDKFKAFRKKQHEEAEQAERTRRAFSCLRVVPDRASPGGTASTSPLVDKKLGQLKPALKAHEECSKLLAGRALPVPGALFQAIEDCLKHRLMAPERVAELHRRRVEGNIGRHDWFDSMGNLTRVN